MATLGQIIARAEELLSDNEEGLSNLTWSKATLADWASEAMAHIAELRPDQFTVTMNIPLKPGATQTVPEDVQAIFEIYGNVNAEADGSVTVADDVSKSDQALMRRFKKKRCLPELNPRVCGDAADTYRVHSFIPNPVNPREFRVDPPVPDGVEVEVSASVLRVPTFGEADTTATVQAATAVLNWIMMRAFSKDIESEFATRERQFYAQAFYHAIGQNYFATSRVVSGYVLGREGTGDPRSGAPRELRSMNMSGM